jgi:hypothetical protein
MRQIPGVAAGQGIGQPLIGCVETFGEILGSIEGLVRFDASIVAHYVTRAMIASTPAGSASIIFSRVTDRMSGWRRLRSVSHRPDREVKSVREAACVIFVGSRTAYTSTIALRPRLVSPFA